MTDDEIYDDWSRGVANVVAHFLVVAKVVPETELKRAADICAEEILVRLVMGDRPDRENWRYKAADVTSESAAWAALQSGSVIALMRHADAPGVFGDPPGFRIEDCATQRNLSDKGRAEAATVGKSFRDRGVRPAHVLSSPWCRCIDTAKLMDVGPVEIEQSFGSPIVWTDRDESLNEGSRAVVRTWKGPGVLLAVTHAASIAALIGYYPASGEIVVVDRALEVIGRIPVPVAP